MDASTALFGSSGIDTLRGSKSKARPSFSVDSHFSSSIDPFYRRGPSVASSKSVSSSSSVNSFFVNSRHIKIFLTVSKSSE